MEKDRLNVFNFELCKSIVPMDVNSFWDFLIKNEKRISQLMSNKNPNISPASGYFYAYPHGKEWFKKHFLKHVEDYWEGVIYGAILDFCFWDETVILDKSAKSGYYDYVDSCDVKTSDEIMPPIDRYSEMGCYEVYFHQLEYIHVNNIIQSMKENIDKSSTKTIEDIQKISKMNKYCSENKGFKVIYQYDISLTTI